MIDAIDSSNWKSHEKNVLEETAKAMKEHREQSEDTPVAGAVSYEKSMSSAPANFAWPGRSSI